MKKPTFIIAGAPRCGTTALYQYLSEHPCVFMLKPKEGHFFAEDLMSYLRLHTSLEQYQASFEGVTSDHEAVGEGASWYLYSKVAMAKIRAFAPEVKIIVMLRNPIDLSYSFHSLKISSCHEDEPDFEKAWNLQADRRKGRNIPDMSMRHGISESLQYAAVAKLGEQIERVYHFFPREQVHCVVMDDLQKSPKKAYEEMLAFLGVPSDGRTKFPRINVVKQRRFPMLTKHFPEIIGILPGWLRRAGARAGLNNLYVFLRTKERKRPPLSQMMRKTMADEFREDVCKLSELVQRDLTHWIA